MSYEHAKSDREALLRDTRRRLARLEIETHRIKAVLARLEAMAEDEAADALVRLFAEHPDDLAFATALASYVAEPMPQPVGVAERLPIESERPIEPSPATGMPSAPLPPVASAPQEPPSAPLVEVDSLGPSGPKHRAGRKESARELRRPAAVNGSRTSAASAAAKRPRRKRSWRPSPPWVASITLHLAIMLVLALLTFAAFREPVPMLAATLGTPDETAIADLTPVEIAPAEVELAEDEPSPLEVADADPMPLSPSELVSHSESLTDASAAELAFAELPVGKAGWLDAAGGGAGEGQADSDGRGTGAAASSFFGAEARADRIVFVVDNSNSMDEGRFLTALMELARSVDSLTPQQSFYVLFYSDAAYRLFHPASEERLIPATRENKERLRAWLSTVELCYGGKLADAMEIAAGLEPQVVYLLSDGVMSREFVANLIAEAKWNFTIHTIGMTVPDQEAAENLLAIAEANGGAFRAVGVAPLAAEMARRSPVKKNRTRGPVWGIKLPVDDPL